MAGLSVAKVRAEKRPGFHTDSTRGLYLRVAPGGSKSWVYRYQVAGKRRLMGLGPVDAVTLAEARDAALAARRLVLVAKTLSMPDAANGMPRRWPARRRSPSAKSTTRT
jgi:hypothetical protein